MIPFLPFLVIGVGLFVGGMRFGSYLNSDANLLRLARDQNVVLGQQSELIDNLRIYAPKVVAMPPFGDTAQYADVINVALRPMTIMLRFVDAPEFERLIGRRNADGFSHPTLSPCEVVIPAEGRIEARPDKASYSAHWVWGQLAIDNILAHEILHCSHGAWHPPEAERRRRPINELGYEIEGEPSLITQLKGTQR